MPSHVIILTDAFMTQNSAALNTTEIGQCPTARFTWLWDNEDVIEVDGSDTWETIGTHVRKILNSLGARAQHTKLVVFPQDGELTGKVAKPNAQVSVIFSGCPKLKATTLKIIEHIAGWGISNIHLQYCWGALPLLGLPIKASTQPRHINVTGFTAECQWGKRTIQTFTVFDRYFIQGLRDYDAPRGRTVRCTIDIESKSRLPHRFIGKPFDTHKGTDVVAAIKGAGQWWTETLNFRMRHKATRLAEGKKRKRE